jgi:hypothetical protein
MTTIFRFNDLPIFMDAFGVAVVFNGQTAKGILDQPTEISLGAHGGYGGIECDKPSLKLAAGTFNPMPAVRDAITVDGNDYTIAERTADGDGAILTYLLKVAA